MSLPNCATSQGKIIDAHAHIASRDYFPDRFLAGVFDNMAVASRARGQGVRRETIERLYLSRFDDPECTRLVQQMDDAGIAQSILLLADFTFAMPGGRLTVQEMLDKHIQVARRHPGRLAVFAGVDPRWGEDGVQLFAQAVKEDVVRGFKVYPPCGFTPSDRLLYPFYEICASRHLPVLIHIGATSPALDFEPARPMYVERAARDFPSVNFILAHGGVHYPQECAMLCSHRPNVYLDVSGYEISPTAELRWIFERAIHHKLLFGTDWPLFRLRGTQRDFVLSLTESADAFPPTMGALEVEQFFFRNAQRLLSREA